MGIKIVFICDWCKTEGDDVDCTAIIAKEEKETVAGPHILTTRHDICHKCTKKVLATRSEKKHIVKFEKNSDGWITATAVNIQGCHTQGKGYSLNYVDYPITIWDDDPKLNTLWKWLIEIANESHIKEIPINIPEGTDIRTLGLSNGQSLLLKHWQRTNNCGDCWTISPWGNKPGQWTANTRSRVAEEVLAIKHWKLGITTWSKPGTYFVDPPYLYNYRYKFKPDSMNFTELANNCLSIPNHSLLIVCEASCPKTKKWPDYLPFGPSHTQITSRRKPNNNHHSEELVYIKRT